MRVQVVDPPAYTPPYDRSLCAALARAGAEVELITSPFLHGDPPPAEGFRVREAFHRRSANLDHDSFIRRPLRAAEHLLDMIRYRSGGADADVIHFQWLPVPSLDSLLLPATHPRLLTPHDLLRADGWGVRPSRALRRLLDRMDALVALSEYGAERLRGSAGVPAERVHVIPHGPLDYLTRLPVEVPLPPDLRQVEGPVVLAFGLIRPYKGTDVLLKAFRELEDAELWIVGRPLGVDVAHLRELARSVPGTVRFVPRFVADAELPAYFRRADLVVLPYTDAEQSGVLYTALAFAKPIVLSAVGGFPEVAAQGAGRLVEPGDPEALAAALGELLADPAQRERLAAAAAAAAAGVYSWEAIAARTLALYRGLLAA